MEGLDIELTNYFKNKKIIKINNIYSKENKQFYVFYIEEKEEEKKKMLSNLICLIITLNPLKLEEVDFSNVDTSNVTNMGNIFYNCSKLKTIPELATNKVVSMGSAFYNCVMLSTESLNNILAMCANATNYSGTKTLQSIGLTSAQATTCTGLSNWSAAQSAGWTTGY